MQGWFIPANTHSTSCGSRVCLLILNRTFYLMLLDKEKWNGRRFLSINKLPKKARNWNEPKLLFPPKVQGYGSYLWSRIEVSVRVQSWQNSNQKSCSGALVRWMLRKCLSVSLSLPPDLADVPLFSLLKPYRHYFCMTKKAWKKPILILLFFSSK